jgi:hypothetical protein
VKDRFDFHIRDVPGFRIEGNDSSITLEGDSFFAEVTGSRNVEIRRLTMKWDQPGHVMMEVTKVLPDTREIEAAILPQYPLKDLEFFWPVGGANTFLIRVDPKFPGKYTGGITARTPRQRLGEGSYRIGPIKERDFKNWQIGDRLAATHYRGGFIQNHDNDKLVLKDITFVDAPGAISGNGGRNDKVAYLNLKVMPDPRFPDSRLAGHASSEGGRVAAWIEGCEFNMLGDDNYNSGYFADYELLRQNDEKVLTMKIQPWDEWIQPGDRLRFADQTSNRGLGEAIAVSVDTSVKNEVKVTFDRKLPQLPASTIVSNNQGNQRFVYRNNRSTGRTWSWLEIQRLRHAHRKQRLRKHRRHRHLPWLRGRRSPGALGGHGDGAAQHHHALRLAQHRGRTSRGAFGADPHRRQRHPRFQNGGHLSAQRPGRVGSGKHLRIRHRLFRARRNLSLSDPEGLHRCAGVWRSAQRQSRESQPVITAMNPP